MLKITLLKNHLQNMKAITRSTLPSIGTIVNVDLLESHLYPPDEKHCLSFLCMVYLC